MKNQSTTTGFAQQTLAQMRRFYGGLEVAHRWMLLGSVAATLLGLLTVGLWASSVPMATLMSGRSYDDIMAAAAALEAAEIPYEIGADGSSLLVPEGSAGRARLMIDQDSEPAVAELEYMQVGFTHQQQMWAFLRAREVSLAKMINDFDPVEKSSVKIVAEEQSLFVGERDAASASVFVKLRPSQKLSPEQVRAITNMVASAVEGLTPERVTLTDHRGRIYSDGEEAGDGLGAGNTTLIEQRRHLRRDYEKLVRSNLLDLLGSPQDFTVGVTVDLNHTSAETHSRDIDPDTIVPVSEEFNEASTERTAPGGTPGVDANLPERNEEDSREKQNSEKLRTRTNNDFSTVETTEVRAPGEIARVSVAVVINQARVQEILDSFGEGAPTVEEYQESIRETIRAAVGYQKERGDVVQVSFTPFAAVELVEETPGFAVGELANYIPHAIAALAMLLTFLFVVRPLVQKVTSVEIKAADDEEDEEERRARELAEVDDLAERLRQLIDNFEPVEAEDLNRLVDHQSDAAAQVLRDWTRSGAG